MSAGDLQLAMQHHRAGDAREAETLYRRVIQAQPTCRDARILLGALLSECCHRDDQAADVYRAALREMPDDVGLQDELAVVLTRLGQFEEAEAAARRDVELEPDSPLLHVHLGNVLTESDRAEAALACYRRALVLDREGAHADEIYYNLAAALYQLARMDEAIAALEGAIALSWDFPEAHAKRGMALIMTGDAARGWPEYEWRLRMRPPPQVPRWDGRELAGATIVLDSDQGMGDAIQMARYATRIKAERGASRVIVRCQPPLHRLLAGVAGVDETLSTEAPPPPDARIASMMSLPAIFDGNPCAGSMPYLRADEQLVRRWAERLAGDGGIRVGLAWAGNAAHRDDRRRSIPPACLRPLAEVPGATFHRLQVGGGDDAPFTMRDHTAELRDFADTAALVEQLDLVITVDTAVAHLAAAAGKPTWVLLSRVPDFRWTLDRDDSPWYPSVRLFRQAVAGDWSGPVARVAVELAKLAPPATR